MITFKNRKLRNYFILILFPRHYSVTENNAKSDKLLNYETRICGIKTFTMRYPRIKFIIKITETSFNSTNK